MFLCGWVVVWMMHGKVVLSASVFAVFLMFLLCAEVLGVLGFAFQVFVKLWEDVCDVFMWVG